MKLMIASDIHGSAYYCSRLMERYEKERAKRILLLGDILYHGPRNELPRDYDPKAVISMLNSKKQDIYCIRGNCDSEVDQMVLEFPIMSDYCIINGEEYVIYAAHGHACGENDPPPLHSGDILLCGHTHVPKCVRHEGFIYMNPGSVSIPKENSWHGYMTVCGSCFEWKDLEGSVKMAWDNKRY